MTPGANGTPDKLQGMTHSSVTHVSCGRLARGRPFPPEPECHNVLRGCAKGRPMNLSGTDVGKRSWGSFSAWAIVGAGASFVLLVFSPIVGFAALIAMGLWALRPTFPRSGFGVLSGAGVPLLYVAFVQRHGPGTVCWHTATSSGCDQYANPWPWLGAGICLVVMGLVGYVRRMRRSRAGLTAGVSGR